MLVSIKRGLAVTALASLLCLATNARAGDPQEDQARALFKEGVALHKAHDYEAALEKFRSAYRLWKNPKILANIGTSAWELKRYAIAANAYDRFLEEAPQDAPERPEVQKALTEVLPRVGTLAIRVTGQAKTVTIDGQQVELTRIRRIRVMPGKHDVVAVSESGARADQSITVGPGQTVALALAVDSSEGQAPNPPVTEKKPVENKVESNTAPVSRGSLPWVVGGIGVASLIASGVFYSLRNSSESKLQSDCYGRVCPDSSSDDIKRGNTYGALSAVTFGIGIAGVGTATYLFLRKPSAETAAEKQAYELYVSGSPHAASATFAGRF